MKESILKLQCKKHIKIFKLSEIGIKPKEIADLLGTNTGNVYNEIKKYKENPERVSFANLITC